MTGSELASPADVVQDGAAAFHLLQRLFTYPLTEGALRPLLELDSDDPRLRPALAGLRQALGGLGGLGDGEGLVAGLNAEYTRLFEGPGRWQVPPYGSAWASDGRLMGPETLAVRSAYLDWQVVPTEMGRLPDDHISLELAFLAFLGEQAGTDDAAERARALRAQAAFLREHLLSWLPRFAEEVARSAPDGFFDHLVRLTIGLTQAYLEEVSGPAGDPVLG